MPLNRQVFAQTLVVAAAVAVTVVSAASLAPGPAQARDGYYAVREQSRVYVDEIETRIARQKDRIRFLMDDGLLRHRGRRALWGGLRDIREEFRYACDDGIVTPEERAYLHSLLDENSRRIAHVRFGHRGYGGDYKHKTHRRYRDRHVDAPRGIILDAPPPPYGSLKDERYSRPYEAHGDRDYREYRGYPVPPETVYRGRSGY